MNKDIYIPYRVVVRVLRMHDNSKTSQKKQAHAGARYFPTACRKQISLLL